MGYEKVVTLFDTVDHAETARRNLEKAGFSTREISIVGKKELASDATLREPGLWHRIFGKDIAEHEARVYGKTVEAGGAVMTLRVPNADVPKAMGILNQHIAVDVQRRAIDTGLITPEAVASAAAAPAKPLATEPAKPLTTEMGKGEVLRLAEEQLEVGKRLVKEGTTRIRRFIVEKPVEAKVTLHEEHIEIVRRVAADPASIKDLDWTDKTMEFVESHEEPVLSKSVHIAEEVQVGKKETDRVETVRDTVRRQDVEVERTLSGVHR